jgi:hypothetical protein
MIGKRVCLAVQRFHLSEKEFVCILMFRTDSRKRNTNTHTIRQTDNTDNWYFFRLVNTWMNGWTDERQKGSGHGRKINEC